MTDIFVDQSTNYFGDESPPITATGSIMVTMTGTLGESKRKPTLSIYARTGAAAFVLAHRQSDFGRNVVSMVAGDEYYVNATGVQPDAAITLSIVTL